MHSAHSLSDHYAEMESSRLSFSSIPELLQEGWTFHLGPAGKLSCAIRPDGTKIGLSMEYDGVLVLDQPSPSRGTYASYGILEYNSTPTEQDKSTAQDYHETPHHMDADEHLDPDQTASSFTNEEVNVDQDLPDETSADNHDIFYAKWISAIGIYNVMSQPIDASGTKRHVVSSLSLPVDQSYVKSRRPSQPRCPQHYQSSI